MPRGRATERMKKKARGKRNECNEKNKEWQFQAVARKKRLKEIGFDYDAECEKAEAAKKEEE